MTDSAYFDDLETRTPEARETALLQALPGQIANARDNAPYFANAFKDVDVATITDRTRPATLPVTRKSDLI